MSRLQAIQSVVSQLGDREFVFHANGAMARESCYCQDRQRNFYLVGSMGLASSTGLGFAVRRPEERVVVLDGDGNLLMGLGNLAIIGAVKPGNLLHIVLDNGVYGTTGNQPTISGNVRLEDLARAAGYPTVEAVEQRGEVEVLLQELWRRPGPRFLLIRIREHTAETIPRIPYTARQNKERFMGSLKEAE